MKIKLIARQGHAALIEHTDDQGLLQRSIVPLSALDGDDISPDQLALGIAAGGLDLTEIITAPLTIDPVTLQNELRRAGVWTKEDYLSKPKIIQGVLQKLYGVDVATLQNIAAGAD